MNAFLLLVMAGLTPAQALQTPGDRPPNFVIVLADDLGYGDLGCYGSTFYETPHLDRLAARGIRFTDGYAGSPVCSPTRAALMTGRHAARLNLTDWLPGRPDRPDQQLARPEIRQQLPLEEITIAEALKPAGYVSASIGKWHLGPEGFWPEDQGFDTNIGGTQAGSPPGGYFGFSTPSLTLEERDPRVYLTDRLNEEAVRFIAASKDQPFLLYLTHYTVHTPLQAKEALVEKYRAKAAEGVDGTQDNPIYAAMIESLDDGIGAILDALEAHGLADNTVFIFTSDNGGLSVREGPNTPATSNAPLRAGKGYLYEGGIRVPWIISWPGTIEPGRTSQVPISAIDLMPTLLDLAGIETEPPAEPDRALDGVSLAPVLRGGASLERASLFWHYPHYSNQGGKPGSAIRRGPYKLIEFFEDGRLELYDLENDVEEARNLLEGDAVPPDMIQLARRLHEELIDWRKATDARMMTPNPDFQASP